MPDEWTAQFGQWTAQDGIVEITPRDADGLGLRMSRQGHTLQLIAPDGSLPYDGVTRSILIKISQ